jgi:hypothetical protein
MTPGGRLSAYQSEFTDDLFLIYVITQVVVVGKQKYGEEQDL